MLAVLNVIAFLAGFFRSGITPVKTGPTAPSLIEQAGAMVPNGALVAALATVAQNAGPAFGNFSMTLVPSSLTANTMNGNQVVGGIIQRFAPTAAFTDCTDTATNIVNAIPGAVPLQTFPLFIANLGSAANAVTMTLAAGAGVTLTGTATISSNCVRFFLGQVTGSAAVTITSGFQFGLGITTGL